MARIAMASFVVMSMLMTGCQPAKLGTNPPAVANKSAAPAYPGGIAPSGIPARPVVIPQPAPISTGPGLSGPTNFPSGPVIVGGGGSAPIGGGGTAVPIGGGGGPATFNPAPVGPVTITPSGPNTNIPSSPSGSTNTTTTTTTTVAGNPSPSGPINIQPAPPVQQPPQQTASAPPASTTIVNTPPPTTTTGLQPTPISTTAAPVSGTEPLGPQQPAPIIPGNTPLMTSPATPGALTSEVTPATQNLPNLPQWRPDVMMANAQQPVGYDWPNLPQALPQFATNCPVALGNCPVQQAALPAPPASQDCRTQSCGPVVPSTVSDSPAPQAAAPEAPAAPAASALPPGVNSCEVKMHGKIDHPKLDILLVMDTSASMRGGHEDGTRGELGMLIPEMDAFAGQLDPNADIRIGMILGHAPPETTDSPDWGKKSPNNIHGRLFEAAGEGAVINYTKLKANCRGDIACTREKVASIMKTKMSHLPNDHTDAQGEALFSSLYDAVSDPKLVQDIKAQDFFRDDAYLTVITISDEQEVCFTYEGTKYKPADVFYTDPVTHKQKRGPDPHEANTYKHLCATAAGGQRMTPELMLKALVDLKGGNPNKVLVEGVHYTHPKIPKALQDQYREMEMGHGYIELSIASGGHIADMALVNRFKKTISFAEQLKDLGKNAKERMDYDNIFYCQTSNAATANLSTVEVHIFDTVSKNDKAIFTGQCVQGEPCDKKFNGQPVDGAAVTTIYTGANPYLKVWVDPKILSEKLISRSFKKGQARIYFYPVSNP